MVVDPDGIRTLRKSETKWCWDTNKLSKVILTAFNKSENRFAIKNIHSKRCSTRHHPDKVAVVPQTRRTVKAVLRQMGFACWNKNVPQERGKRVSVVYA